MPPPSPATARAARTFYAFALVGLSYLFRVPPLLNARSTNSDAAVVGLEAMHVLRREIPVFLWGSGYQTSADALAAALFFEVAGPTPLALMMSALTLHVVATGFVFATLRRHLAPALAFLATLPLVLSPSSIHTYALYPPRQASLTLMAIAFWAIDGAGRPGRKPARNQAFLGVGSLCATLAVAADPYPLVLLPIAALFAAMVAGSDLARWASAAFGGAAGAIVFFLVRLAPGAKSGPLGLSIAVYPKNLRLFVEDCLPWAASYKVYFARHAMDYAPWDAPAAFRVLGVVGAALVGLVVCMGIVAVFFRGMPWPLRRLGLVGAISFPVTIAGFLTSVMVMDHFSMRYLAVLTSMLPFAAAPAARLFGTRGFALVFLPHVAAAAIAGWVGYGPFVHGVVPVRETPELADDLTLLDALHGRGVRYAEADYWASYRLTFLAREAVIVVPTNAAEDRYYPYRRGFLSADRFAYVFDPSRSREDLAGVEATLAHESQHVERARAGRLTYFIVDRTKAVQSVQGGSE